MSKEENLRAGLTALRSGDVTRAAGYFAQVVKDDPNSEQGWFLLGTCCGDREQRLYCYRRVLAINPRHAEAQRELEDLLRPLPPLVPPFHTLHSPLLKQTANLEKKKAEEAAQARAAAAAEQAEHRNGSLPREPAVSNPSAADPAPASKVPAKDEAEAALPQAPPFEVQEQWQAAPEAPMRHAESEQPPEEPRSQVLKPSETPSPESMPEPAANPSPPADNLDRAMPPWDVPFVGMPAEPQPANEPSPAERRSPPPKPAKSQPEAHQPRAASAEVPHAPGPEAQQPPSPQERPPASGTIEGQHKLEKLEQAGQSPSETPASEKAFPKVSPFTEMRDQLLGSDGGSPKPETSSDMSPSKVPPFADMREDLLRPPTEPRLSEPEVPDQPPVVIPKPPSSGRLAEAAQKSARAAKPVPVDEVRRELLRPPTTPPPVAREDLPAKPPDAEPPEKVSPAGSEKPQGIPSALPPVPAEIERGRSSTRTLIYSALIFGGVVICGLLSFVGLLLSGSLDRWLLPAVPPVPVGSLPAPFDGTVTSTLPPLRVSPTFQPTETPLPTNSPTPLPTALPTVAYTPVFENAPCTFKVPAGVDVRCGFAVVPEDRTGSPNRTIRLAVAVYRSFSDTPAPEPVLFLQGGPGAEAVKLSAAAYPVLVEPFLARGDFVVFDQRGTGLSEPSLECDELTKSYLQDIHGLIDIGTRELVYSNAFLSCQGLMDAQGIHLNAYTTTESAADVRDILSLLGYEKANLYGASYGTRLAQVIMRDYPGIVRSAVLDSVVPIETNLFSHYPDAIESGLGTLFANCTADPRCNQAYPDLEKAFWDMVDRLDSAPVTVTTSDYPQGTITETVTGTTVMNLILSSIKDGRFISTAPQSIYRFKTGDYSTLVLQQSSLPFTFEGISPGLFISMMCHEQILTTSPDELQHASESPVIKEFAWLPFYGDAQHIFKTCQDWGAQGPTAGENDPVQSDIPTLIISGAYDPTTPPLYARQLADHLSRSFYFEFPNQGHTPTASDSSGCAMDLVLEFLDDPTTQPSSSCLDSQSAIDFVVPYTGDPALSLKAIQVDGVQVQVPQDWRALQGGFFYRGNSPFDITEVGVLRIPASSSDIEDYFSLSAFGYRGLDSPLIPAGERKANGITWRLFTSSSYGRPVDIAMSGDGNMTNVLIMFCNLDEHDPLYRTVFLPMVDSAGP